MINMMQKCGRKRKTDQLIMKLERQLQHSVHALVWWQNHTRGPSAT